MGHYTRILIGLGLFASSLFVSHWSFRRYFQGGTNYEFCHYAEIARNILEGRGYRTSVFYPSELAYLKNAGADPAPMGPVLTRFPLYAYWSALWMKIGGADDYGMALGNMAAMALWVVAIYAAALHFFGLRTAVISALLWLALPVLQTGYVLLGYTELLFGGLVQVFVFLLARVTLEERLQTPRAYFALGFFAGVIYLARYSFALWLPALLALPLLWRMRGGWRFSLWFSAGFLLFPLAVSCCTLRHIGSAVSPLLAGNLAEHVLVKGLPFMEYRPYGLGDFMGAAFPKLIFKAWSLFNYGLMHLSESWDLQLLFPFAIAAMAVSKGGARRYALLTLALMCWHVAAFSFIRYEQLGYLGNRHFLWFLPLVMVFGVEFWVKAAEKPGKGRVFAGVFLLVQLQLMASLYWRTTGRGGVAVSDWEELRVVRDMVPETATVMANVPAQVGWYARRKAVNITNRVEDVPRLAADWPCDYLLLSWRGPASEIENYPDWARAISLPPREAEEVFKSIGFAPVRRFSQAALFRKI
ncbi:MAG: glycosyltransferase family 39 protein [Elusimicrobia bacterium]|nr:glycosyltransferase family 39 protein [Elusimicrobiota bacterium]